MVGLLWRGGGDEEEVDDDDPLFSDEWLPREVLAYPPLLELPREQIMRIKHKLDAQARSDAIELGMQYPRTRRRQRGAGEIASCAAAGNWRKKHPEFDTEFDPVKVVRPGRERSAGEGISLSTERRSGSCDRLMKKRTSSRLTQRVAAPRKSHNKPLRPPPPRPLKKSTPSASARRPFHGHKPCTRTSRKGRRRRATPRTDGSRSCMETTRSSVLRLAANQPANINFEWKDGALIIVGYVDEEAGARSRSGRCTGGAIGFGERRLLARPRPRVCDGRTRISAAPLRGGRAGSASLAAEPPAAEASQWHKPTGGPSETAPAGPSDEEHRPPADAIPAGLFARPTARPRLCVLKYVDANANKRDLPAKTKERTKSRTRTSTAVCGTSSPYFWSSIYTRRGSLPVWKSNLRRVPPESPRRPPHLSTRRLLDGVESVPHRRRDQRGHVSPK